MLLKASPFLRGHGIAALERAARSAFSFHFRPANGVMHEIVGRFQFQLSLDVRAMHLDGFHAQMQELGDVARALAAPDQLEHFKFAVGKPLDGSAAASACRPEKFSRIRADIFSLT